jgi:hypothetical protein
MTMILASAATTAGATVASVSAVGRQLSAGAGSHAHRLAAGYLAAIPGDYDPSSGHGPEWGKAAPAGLLIWLFLGAALFVIVKSMSRHIRRLPKNEDGSAATDMVASDHGWVPREGTGLPPDGAEASEPDEASPPDGAETAQPETAQPETIESETDADCGTAAVAASADTDAGSAGTSGGTLGT